MQQPLTVILGSTCLSFVAVGVSDRHLAVCRALMLAEGYK
jgi:hypothetical protein